MQMSEYVVELKNATKRFPGVVALKNMQLSVKPGEILGLIGENGSGKSTVSSIIAGMQPASSGEMFYKGKLWKPATMLEAQKAGIGMIVQEAGTIANISVAENIFLGNYDKFQRCHAYETAFALKKEGKIRHVGLSFHDKAEVLERILGDHPDVEFVQIQMNYIDMESTAVDARRVYETCLRFHKPVIVMEPVKGGGLVKLPPKAQHLFDTLQQGAYPKASNASYAIRFVAGHEGIFMVLSGMSTLSQVADNTSFMKDFKPLTDKEKRTLDGVVEVFSQLDAVPCTACRYCIEENHCPKKIPIPDIFSLLNSMRVFNNHNANFYYENVVTANAGKASDCILCGACEHVCPQHLTIRKFLKEAAATFEEPKKG